MSRRRSTNNLHDIYLSLVHGDGEFLKRYKQLRGHLDIKGAGCETLLIRAVKDKDLSKLGLLLRLGCSINCSDHGQRTALHHATERGQSEFTVALIKAGACVNAADKNGMTPLMEAVRVGDERSAIALLDAGCLVNAVNKENERALGFAVGVKCKSLVETLTRHGTNLSLANWCGSTPIIQALVDKEFNLAEIMLAQCTQNDVDMQLLHLLNMIINYIDNIESTDVMDYIFSYGADLFAVGDGQFLYSLYQHEHQITSETSLNQKSIDFVRYLIRDYGLATSHCHHNYLLGSVLGCKSDNSWPEGITGYQQWVEQNGNTTTQKLNVSEHGFSRQTRQRYMILCVLMDCGLMIHPQTSLKPCAANCECRKFITSAGAFVYQSVPDNNLRLQAQCRTVIRKCLGLGVSRKVSSLGIPSSLKRYLCFEEELKLWG